MKISKSKFFTFILCLFYLTSFNQVLVKSKIESATLYLNGAFIKRTAQIELQKGKTKLLFSDIPSTLDINSIQISADEKVKIVSVKSSAVKTKNNSDLMLVKNMEDSISQIQSLLQITEIKLKVLMEEEAILRKNQPSFTENYAIKPLELKDVLHFNSTKLTEIFMATQVQKNELLNHTNNIKEIRKRIHAVRNKEFITKIQLEVEVEVLDSGTSTFAITYFTMFSSWYPTYDVRVLDISQPIEMNMKASIIQNTGEDWENIKLSVSNGQPSGTETFPIINPWYLSYYQYKNPNNANFGNISNIKSISGIVTDEDGAIVIGANVVLKEFNEIGTITDIDGKYYLPLPNGAKNVVVSYAGYETLESTIQNENMNFMLSEGKLMDEIVVVGSLAGKSSGIEIAKDKVLKDFNNSPTNISYQPTTFSYDLKETITLKSSTTMVMLDVLSHQIQAIYHYYTVPKYDKSVFLTAGILGWQDYNLLDGKINLYLEGKYLGQSALNTKAAGDTLQISLGRDQSVVVERTKIKEFAKKSFMSGNTTEIKAFSLSIKNNKSQPIRVRMQDHIPLSTDKSIEIFDFEAKTGIIHPDTRIVTWEIEVKPKSEQTKELRYTVKYPNSKRLEID